MLCIRVLLVLLVKHTNMGWFNREKQEKKEPKPEWTTYEECMRDENSFLNDCIGLPRE